MVPVFNFLGLGGADHILGISYHTLAFSVIFLGSLTKEDSEYIYEEDITFGPMITTSSVLWIFFMINCAYNLESKFVDCVFYHLQLSISLSLSHQDLRFLTFILADLKMPIFFIWTLMTSTEMNWLFYGNIRSNIHTFGSFNKVY